MLGSRVGTWVTRVALAVLVLVAAVSGTALAQDPPPPADDGFEITEIKIQVKNKDGEWIDRDVLVEGESFRVVVHRRVGHDAKLVSGSVTADAFDADGKRIEKTGQSVVIDPKPGEGRSFAGFKKKVTQPGETDDGKKQSPSKLKITVTISSDGKAVSKTRTIDIIPKAK